MPNSREHLRVFAVTAAIGLARAAIGQTADMHILYTNTGPIKAASLPVLHNGVFAGLGYRPDWSFVVYSGHLGAASDTPPHIIAAPGDPVPNVPNESFAFFRFPTVWNGSVYFPGKSGSGGPNPPDGACTSCVRR